MSSVDRPGDDAMPPGWPEKQGLDDGFRQVSRQAHSALQWLARLAHSYREAEPGNRHLLLDWVDGRGTVVTQEIAPGTDVELRLPSFVMHFRDDGTPTPHPMVLDEKSPAEVEAWCLIELLHRSIERDRFSKALPYDVASLMKGDADQFETIDREGAFDELTALLHQAAAVLTQVAAGRGMLEPARLLIDPQDFALFVSCVDNGDSGESSEEFGLCLGDPSAEQAFFYFARPPRGVPAGLSRIPAEGPARSRAPGSKLIGLDEVREKGMTPADVAAALSGSQTRPS